MKRLLPLLLLLIACAGGPTPESQGPLPTWNAAGEREAPGPDHVLLQALILEVPAQGLEAPRTGRLDVRALNEVMKHPGVKILQSPSITTTPDRPATIFVGETDAGNQLGLRLEFTQKTGGVLAGDFDLTSAKPDGSPYQAAEAQFELEVGGPAVLVEMPGRRFVLLGDETVEQARVFLIAVEARAE